MKPWKDASIFEGLTPPCFFAEGSTRYYKTADQKSVECIIPMPDPPSWCMLWSICIYREELGARAHHRREMPRFLAIEHIREGSLYFRQDGRMYLAEPGDICLMLPWRSNEFMTGPQGFCRKSSVVIIGPLMDDILARTRLNDVDILEHANGARFEALLGHLIEASKSFGDAAAMQFSSLTYEVVQLMARREASPALPTEMIDFLSYMQAHLSEPLTLQDLARRYGCTSARLIRIFHKYVGATPYRVLTQMRMRQALRLLVERDCSVKEVASLTGYNNPLNFSTEFKKHFGSSPQNYKLRGMPRSEQTAAILNSH